MYAWLAIQLNILMSKCLWVWQMSLTRFVSFLLIQLDTGQIGIICILAIELGVSGMQPGLSFFIPKQFLKIMNLRTGLEETSLAILYCSQINIVLHIPQP